MVPHTSIHNSLGIHGIFWSLLEDAIGHGSIVPSFGALNLWSHLEEGIGHGSIVPSFGALN